MELRYILEILWSKRRLAVGIFSFIFLAVVIGTLLMPARYDATAKVLLRKAPASDAVLKSIGMSDTFTTSASLSDTERSNYLALAALRPIAEKTVSDLNLKRIRIRSWLINAIPGFRTVLAGVGLDMGPAEKIMTAEELLDRPLSSFIFPRPHIAIDQHEDTDIIEIKGISPLPEQAMAIANSMANNFIEEELKRIRRDYAGAKAFIDHNIVKARQEYIDAITRVQDLKEKEKFVNLDTEATNIIEKISDFKKSYEDNRLSIHKLKATIRNIESQIKSIPKYQKSSELLKYNEVILNLKNTLRDLYLSLAETKTRYTSKHPSVIDIENKIAQIKELLQVEMTRIFGEETVSVDSVYQELSEKLASNYADLAGYEIQNEVLPKIIDRYDNEMMKMPKQVAEYTKLQLSVSVIQDVYNALLKHHYQVGMMESVALSNIYLVEAAIEPQKNDSKHKKPSLPINLIMAVIMGFIFSIGGILFVNYLDDTIKSAKDIETDGELNFLGHVMELDKKTRKLIFHMDPKHPFNESIRSIRNNINHAFSNKMLKSIVVTSHFDLEGKSFFAANLAVSLANEGKKVLIVDGDLRKSGIWNYFGLPRGAGLTDYLLGNSEFESVLCKTDIEGLHIIPSGSVPHDPAKLVETDNLHDLILQMAGVYDVVIIDTPSLKTASDAIILGRWTDGSILILQEGRVRTNDFSDMLALFKRAKVNLIGVVFNRGRNNSLS